MKIRFIIPFILFMFIGIVLWRGLHLRPAEIPSPLVNKTAPHFELPMLADASHLTSNKDFLGHVTLLNVWATWCVSCAEEHAFLMALAQKKHVILYGLNYKDDLTAAQQWLHDKGNPYLLVAVDKSGSAAIDWGVYGTPETFVIDKKGIVRYKNIGSITPAAWDKTIAPLIHKLEGETE